MQDNTNPQQNKAMMDQVALDQYIDDMITARGDVAPENKAQVKSTLLKEINEDINLHLINLLTPQNQVALDELLDKNPTDDELNAFFVEKIPNLQDELTTALIKFREGYLLPITPDLSSIAQAPTALESYAEPTVAAEPPVLAEPTKPEDPAMIPPPLPPAPVTPRRVN